MIKEDKRKANVLGNMAIFCVRYALGRKTSADMACTTSLKFWWDEIPENQQKIILEEIESEKNLIGHDSWLWDDFVKWVNEHELS